ncbi:2-haloacid dehalogenase [Sediminihabitans luteus]|uniref:2-haloacid dehalogenase n=1 Tax=Sediminihabitans luteus TaxID=1138585 RepID=A0A2M9CQK6_9CELL|nr:HAD family phosphatase [Sediminihabitans luteus]PJJ74220.1 2-haloacid dehalogenase [Sediminihabitans luteus]GII99073.1 hydrolase [Sediminihabitans luteus]
MERATTSTTGTPDDAVPIDAVTTEAAPTDRVPVDAVLYDFGNVLVGWDPAGAIREGMSAHETERFLRADDFDFGAFNHAQDAGRSWADALAELARTHPHHVPAVEAYLAHFPSSLTGPVEGSAELVAELDALGLALYGLTNWSAELFHGAEPAAPAIGRMRDVVVSGREGLAKPDPAIFELAIARFGLDPARTVFVDDSPSNVATAVGLGFVALLFTGTSELRRRLRDLGVDVAPA